MTERRRGFTKLLPHIPPRQDQLDQLLLSDGVLVNGADSAQRIQAARTRSDDQALLTLVAQLAAFQQHAGVLNNKGCALAFLDDFDNARAAFVEARRAKTDWPGARDAAKGNIAVVDAIRA
jgi:hypothetical protein